MTAPAEDMVWIDGASYRMGSDSHYPEEAPAHRVVVEGFWIDVHQVTNRDFAAPTPKNLAQPPRVTLVSSRRAARSSSGPNSSG